MKVLEKVKDALKRKSKGQNVMVGLAGAISVVIAIIIVYYNTQFDSAQYAIYYCNELYISTANCCNRCSASNCFSVDAKVVDVI